MTFQESIRSGFAKYADFSGTASRSEYWWFVLFLALVNGVASAIGPSLVVGGAGVSLVAPGLTTVVGLVTIVPLLAVGTRRLRDTGRSGWLQFLFLVPVGGIIILAIFFAQEGKPNQSS